MKLLDLLWSGCGSWLPLLLLDKNVFLELLVLLTEACQFRAKNLLLLTDLLRSFYPSLLLLLPLFHRLQAQLLVAMLLVDLVLSCHESLFPGKPLSVQLLLSEKLCFLEYVSLL
ncbi:hypothetical protein K457DRAFT_142476 [Linnemannia elongata AG-77]|uniref:Uncharacterized protein n=1 Tax=Linnemannia elongata AG-77 TaxID=1314771 RepID=A0A197JF65_9FUNG|nr:hypothetical protein K457DRAFT_142476 [Linnemannia elongata AG-77]